MDKRPKILVIRPETEEFIRLFNELKGISFNKNEDLLEVLDFKTTSSISEILKRRSNISLDKLQKFKNKFRNNIRETKISVDVKSQVNAFAVSELQEIDDESPFIDLHNGQYIMIVPHVQEYAHAGYASSGFSDAEFIEELPKHSFIVNKQHRGKYVAFTVIGESMDNDRREAITEGMIVTGREIKRELWNSRFHIHRFKDYIIVHKEGILVKRIIEHDVANGIITCHSLNPDKDRYPDFTLNLDDCNQIFNIVNKSEAM